MPIQSANPPDLITLTVWLGLNQQTRRGSIEDQELWWNENLLAVAPGNLRSCWGPSAPIYTVPAGNTIRRIFFGYIGYPTPILTEPPPGRLGWMFYSPTYSTPPAVGSSQPGFVDQVDLDTGQVTPIGQIWTDIYPYHYADAVVWRPRFFGNVPGEQGGVLFGSPQGLYAWDGTTLSVPGGPAPNWLTNFDQTGFGNTIMPTGLPGILAMEVYQGRLWVAGEDVIAFSAPANGSDFIVIDGGGVFGYSGNKLTVTYRDLCASAGYLYVYGDSSTDLISNVTAQSITVGDLTTTTSEFNYQNLDPMVGHAYPRKVGRYGRDMILANGARPFPSTAISANSGTGIWRVIGGDIGPIGPGFGQKITNLWETVDTSQFYPTFATVTMFGARIVLCNGMFTDPFGVKRSLMLAWNGLFWTVMAQNLPLTHIGYYEQDSICDAYGTEGTHLYHLFDHPDNSLVKKLSTKALKTKGPLGELTINNWRRVHMELHDMSGQGVSFTGKLTNVGCSTPGGTQDIAFQMPPGQPSAFLAQATQGQGILGSVDLQSISPDFSIERIHFTVEPRTLEGA